MSRESNLHLSDERLQAFLEGELPQGERAPVEEHLAACSRCSAELDAWRVLFEDLSGLAAATPSPGFANRVMERVEVPARQRSWLASLFPAKAAHVTAEVLQDLADGAVPARRVARIREHLDACPTCASDLEAWHGVVATLNGLDRFAPPAGFAARVMAAIRARTAAVAPVRVRAPRPAWAEVGGRALAFGQRFVPRSRRAWAALSGAAVTPAAIFGLVAYVVFSHPTLTVQALVSFALWQLGDLFTAGWNAAGAAGLELASALTTRSLVDLVSGSPLVVAGFVLAYSALSAVALRVLYKNLLGNRSYARASTR